MNFFKNYRDNRKIEKTIKRFDGLTDPYTSRGGTLDRTTRLQGVAPARSWVKHKSLYKSNGFIRNIINSVADDSIREWIKLETNFDDDYNISRLIQNRIDSLGVRKKLRDLIKYYRMFKEGSFLYYGVIANAPQDAKLLNTPLPIGELRRIDYINVIDNPERVSLLDKNNGEPLKKDYKKFNFLISGIKVHDSRFSWLVNDFDPERKEGQSIIDIIFDAISAQDSALWSTSCLVQDMATKIFKSDLIANLSPEKRAELLSKLKHIMTTLSSIAITSDEDFQKLTYNVTGMKEVFDFILDNLAGVSNTPKNILLGKSHGVVTAGEYDTLNYYAKVAQFQENDLRPIIDKIINLIICEQDGEIYKTIGGKVGELDWNYEFISLWVLDPVAQADVELKKSQRDEIDFNIGKVSSTELRKLDSRYSELEDVETAAQKEVEEITTT